MRKSLVLLPILLIGLFMNSCTIHQGQVINLNYGRTVSIPNQAIGTSSVGYFFGLGGNNSSVLLKEAKDDLIRNRPLQPNEKYVNQNLNISTTYFLFYTRTRFTLTADIIINEEQSISETNPTLERKNNELFNLGDSLISKSQKFKGFFIEKVEDSKVKVINKKQVYKLLNADKVYRKGGSYNGYKTGDQIDIKTEYKGSGKIIGFGKENVIVIDKYGSNHIINYNEISKSN